MPDTVPCDAGTEYSEAVVAWTNGNKAMIAVWDGIDWICPCDFWEAWGEEITHWMPLTTSEVDSQEYRDMKKKVAELEIKLYAVRKAVME